MVVLVHFFHALVCNGLSFVFAINPKCRVHLTLYGLYHSIVFHLHQKPQFSHLLLQFKGSLLSWGILLLYSLIKLVFQGMHVQLLLLQLCKIQEFLADKYALVMLSQLRPLSRDYKRATLRLVYPILLHSLHVINLSAICSN